MATSDVLSVEQAAERLGVSRIRVQKLVEAGELPATRSAGAWWVDARAVERRRRMTPSAGRPLSASAAWLVLLFASGQLPGPDWRPLLTHGHSRDRAIRWLAGHPLAEHAWALRARADRETLDGHPSEIPLILAHERVMATGISAASRVGLTGGGAAAEFYAPRGDRDAILEEHALRPAADGAVVARWVPDELWPALAPAEATPDAAVLVDLLEHDDPRVRREAVAALAR